MSATFPPDDPLAVPIEAGYREAWSSLSEPLRAKLRAGVDSLSAGEVRELVAAPHPLVTLSYWFSKPEGARWDVSVTFAEWPRAEAPE